MEKAPYQGIKKPEWITNQTWSNFWKKVYVSNHGSMWNGAQDGHGYGNFWVPEQKKFYRVHRLVFEWSTGVVPEIVDHVCSISNCITLDHLENVTQAENLKRTYERGRGNSYWARQTHCKNGHEWNEQNTRIVNKTGGGTQRACRVCQKEYMRMIRKK
jgi:hypothetical protein